MFQKSQQQKEFKIHTYIYRVYKKKKSLKVEREGNAKCW